MDYFTSYGDDFDQAMQMLEKVLEQCIATRLCSRNVKCHMMMTKGVILGYYSSAAGIQVDPTKIQVILLLPTPCTQTELHSFLIYAGYHRRFIKRFHRLWHPYML